MSKNIDFDTIIIGSGAGGLSAAICLSKAGQRVLVLEQHYTLGGWCHSFYLNGHRFTPGVHYIGLLGKGQSTRELYEGLGIANDLTFFRMNPSAYEHCLIGDERIDLPADFDELNKTLADRFPQEKKGIAKYLNTVRDVSRQLQLIPKMNGFWDNITIPWRTRYLGKYGLFSLKKVIDWHIKDPLLKKILNIQCGDHGLPPAKASFPLHCAVMDHYFSGGYYPMGGGGAIVKAMSKAIKNNGGELRASQTVKKILLEGIDKKQAVGVELENGEQLFAKRIISNADPGITYLKLIGASNLSSKLLKKLSKTKYSCTSLMLFLTVDMDVQQAGLDSGNLWVMSGDENKNAAYEEIEKENILEGDIFSGLFISCTTLKDPTSFDGHHHTIEAITFISYESFRKFEGKDYANSAAYLQYKELVTKKMIKSLEKILPGISGNIVHQELGSPMTNEYYINTTNGCVYGTEKSFKQIGPFGHKAESEIENLFLCGSSILSHGVAGASYSGVQTAAKILKCSQDDLIKPDSSQNLNIFEAEDDSEYPDWVLDKIRLRKKHFESKMKASNKASQSPPKL